MISALGENSMITVLGLTKPADTSKDQKSWTQGEKYSGVSCYIEQLDAKNTLMFEGKVSAKVFLLMVQGNLDITEADKIFDNHSREFVVQSVQAFVGDPDIPDHIEAQMVQRYPTN